MSSKINKSLIVNTIKSLGKYQYYIVNKNKAILLGSDNSNTEAKKQVLNKLSNKIDKYLGKTLIRLKLGLTSKIDKRQVNKKMLGGPMFIKIERYQIKSKNKLLKTEKVVNYFFYDPKILSKRSNNIELLKKELKLLSFAFRNELYNMSVFNIKYVTKIIENLK